MSLTGRGGAVALLLCTLFLTYCLAYGTAAQSKDAEIRSLQSASISREAKARRIGVLQSVYTVCNDSRISATITEASCAALQDSTRTEFLCDGMGTSPQLRCWVEDKSGPDSQPYLTYPAK